jgi:phage baseplate assembly protein gpV
MFADQAEERRLQADASIALDQDDFEVFAAQVLDTCDGNRVTQSAILEGVISETRTSYDELLVYCRKALDGAIAGEIKGLKEFLSSQYGYAGHAPGPHSQRPQEEGYFEEEEQDYTDAVQEFVHHVTHPQAEQAQHIIQWLQARKVTLESNIAATEDQLEAKQEERASWEANGFGEQVTAWIGQNGDLAATLLKDVQSKNDAVQATLDDLKNTHYGHVDAHGYRYKLLHQLHHQRVAFEQAVEAAWTTWSQSRDLTLDTAASHAYSITDSFQNFLLSKSGEWAGASEGVRAAMAGQLAERGENLKGAIQ